MYERAIEAIGEPAGQGSPQGAIWKFPDTETRDLVGRIFGDLRGQTNGDKYKQVKGPYTRPNSF